MQTSRVILANEPRLLRGMLRRAIARAPALEVVGEVTDPVKLSSLVNQSNARWVIVSLWPEGLVPGAIESLLSEHSSVCILGMAADGSRARLKRAECPDVVAAEMTKMGSFLLQMAQERAEDKGIAASAVLRHGHLRAELKAAVREYKADLLVLGKPAGDESAYAFKELENLATGIESEPGIQVLVL